MDTKYNSQSVKPLVAFSVTFISLLTAYYLRAWETSDTVFTPRPMSFQQEFKTSRIVLKEYRSLGPNPEIENSNSSDRLRSEETIGYKNMIQENADHQVRSIKTLKKDETESSCVKQIQLYSSKGFEFPEKEYDCPQIACKARYIHSNSYERLATSHAVILHHRAGWNPEKLARYRPDGQMWIYMTKESPIHSNKMFLKGPIQVAYNWSMSYNADSEFVVPYGRYVEGVPTVPKTDNRNWAAGKTKLVAWMSSNCMTTSWHRTRFVMSLQKYVHVDRYGKCGNQSCPRRSEDCDRILSAHKFYLSLENSECDDYITEKFWKNGLSLNMVPIVYGTTRDRYERVAPSHSFIHVSDFKNMTALVDYIKYLDKNDTAYNEYFEWKKKGSVESYTQTQAASPDYLFCGIVKKLKEIDDQILMKNPIKSNVVDLERWRQEKCKHRQSVWSS